MENLILDLEELYGQVKERALDEGAFTRDEWNSIVEVVLDELRVETDDHDDMEWLEIQEALQKRYKEFAGEIPEV